MRTIALRFSNNFAPEAGTIAEHQEIITKLGFVWYGKLGTTVSSAVISQILENEEPKILLIHSGAIGRYWAYIDAVQKETPETSAIPEYYRDMTDRFNTWFRVIRFEDAPKNILSQCTVASSGATLSQASRHSMSPYFIIETNK
jgi:hypothetical protein